jgi:hypothetical protein
MPVLSTTSLSSGPGNAFGLVQYVQQRCPGYDPSEYLRELNSAYEDVFEEITKLKNSYFSNTKSVTVTKSQFSYDLMFNADAALSGVLSSRLYQVTRVRIQPQGVGLLQPVTFVSTNSPDYVGLAANPLSTAATTGPYLCYMQGRNNLFFAQPLAIGTVIEVTYTFSIIGLNYSSMGTVSSSGVTVTGNGTLFTNIIGPDNQASLPLVHAQEEILADLICSPGTSRNSRTYQVATITSDTALTTATAIAPVLGASSPYILAIVPEIPHAHIRVIGSIALAKIYSVDGDDSRMAEWTAIAEKDLQMMKDSLEQRQSQNPPKKGRFPGSLAGRGRTWVR